jgi:hypothetical protein
MTTTSEADSGIVVGDKVFLKGCHAGQPGTVIKIERGKAPPKLVRTRVARFGMSASDLNVPASVG